MRGSSHQPRPATASCSSTAGSSARPGSPALARWLMHSVASAVAAAGIAQATHAPDTRDEPAPTELTAAPQPSPTTAALLPELSWLQTGLATQPVRLSTPQKSAQKLPAFEPVAALPSPARPVAALAAHSSPGAPSSTSSSAPSPATDLRVAQDPEQLLAARAQALRDLEAARSARIQAERTRIRAHAATDIARIWRGMATRRKYVRLYADYEASRQAAMEAAAAAAASAPTGHGPARGSNSAGAPQLWAEQAAAISMVNARAAARAAAAEREAQAALAASQWAAARKLQSWWALAQLRCLARRVAARRRVRRRQAAQAIARTWLAYRLRQRVAARVIWEALAQHGTKQAAHRLATRGSRAVIRLQARCRGRRARARVRILRKRAAAARGIGAVRRLQAHFRRRQAQRWFQHRRKFLRYLRAASTVQRWWRLCARSRQRRTAARKSQAHIQAARQTIRLDAATRIQALARGFAVRRRLQRGLAAARLGVQLAEFTPVDVNAFLDLDDTWLDEEDAAEKTQSAVAVAALADLTAPQETQQLPPPAAAPSQSSTTALPILSPGFSGSASSKPPLDRAGLPRLQPAARLNDTEAEAMMKSMRSRLQSMLDSGQSTRPGESRRAAQPNTAARPATQSSGASDIWSGQSEASASPRPTPRMVLGRSEAHAQHAAPRGAAGFARGGSSQVHQLRQLKAQLASSRAQAQAVSNAWASSQPLPVATKPRVQQPGAHLAQPMDRSSSWAHAGAVSRDRFSRRRRGGGSGGIAGAPPAWLRPSTGQSMPPTARSAGHGGGTPNSAPGERASSSGGAASRPRPVAPRRAW